MKHLQEVVIVGGGPAGAYCAFELAKRGIYCPILDYSHPREKPCGGGISHAVIRKFPFVENFRSMGSTFVNVNLISCTNIRVKTKILENGFCISRKDFDWELLNMAVKKGAKLINEKVIDIQKEKNHWKIKTNKKSLLTRILVGADGVNSVVRRRIISPISKDNLELTFGYIATEVEKEKAAIKLLGYIPGYIWVFPGKKQSKIGIGSKLEYGHKLKSMLDSFIRDYCPQSKLISKYAALIPSANNKKFFDTPCAGENWVVIGDAAGHVDPISGEGILFALWGGKLAAESIIMNSPKSFDIKWRKEYGKNLEKSCLNKEDFYDPIKSTISIFEGLKENRYYWP